MAEVERKKRLADYGLHSERLLMRRKEPGVFERELGDLEDKLMLTTVEKAVAWAQGHSIWPDTFGLACCAMEMIAIVSPRYDVARFGAEVFRSSPRQADLLIVSGRVAHKMAKPLRQIYDQMLEPKWVIAMGACASSGGMFANYAILQGVDKIVPVDVHVPGCPPRPEALLEGIVRLQEKIIAGVPPAYEIREVASVSYELRVPGFVEGEGGAYGETTRRRRAARLRRRGAATFATSSGSTSSRTSRRPTTSAGTSAPSPATGAAPPGATSIAPARGVSPGSPSRSRSASPSPTTSSARLRRGARPRGCDCRSGATTARPSPA